MSEKKEYPVGFQYMMGGNVYTVRKDITKDANCEMRELTDSLGNIEQVTIETIKKDLKDYSAKILKTGEEKEK